MVTNANVNGPADHHVISIIAPTPAIALIAAGMLRFHGGGDATVVVNEETRRGAFAIISNSASKSPTACQRRFGFF